MANDRPDFTVKTPSIAPDAIATILQRKRTIENDQNQQALNNFNDRMKRISDAVIAGQTVASNMMTLAEKRQDLADKKKKAESVQAIQNISTEPEDVQQPASPEMQAAYKASRQGRLEAAFAGAEPDQYVKNKMKAEYASSYPTSKRFQQSALEIKDSEGRPVTVTTTFDTVTGKQINPMTGKEIKTAEDAKDLLKRGYAQSTRSAGYDAEGNEVVEDTRTGGKFVTTIGPNGEQKNVAYNGAIYPKLENPPATFTSSLAELGNAQQLLTNITKSFDPKYVGPVAARAGKMTQYAESLTEPQKVEFYKNSIIKAITGAQMSEVEAKRIIQQIPNENSSPTAFLAGIKRSYLMTDRKLNEMQKAISRSGGVVRGKNENPISEEDLNKLIETKLGKITSKSAVPSVGGTYNGAKVLSVKKVK